MLASYGTKINPNYTDVLITETKGTHLTTNLENIKKKEYFLYYENIEHLNNISVKWID